MSGDFRPCDNLVDSHLGVGLGMRGGAYYIVVVKGDVVLHFSKFGVGIHRFELCVLPLFLFAAGGKHIETGY